MFGLRDYIATEFLGLGRRSVRFDAKHSRDGMELFQTASAASRECRSSDCESVTHVHALLEVLDMYKY